MKGLTDLIILASNEVKIHLGTIIVGRLKKPFQSFCWQHWKQWYTAFDLIWFDMSRIPNLGQCDLRQYGMGWMGWGQHLILHGSNFQGYIYETNRLVTQEFYSTRKYLYKISAKNKGNQAYDFWWIFPDFRICVYKSPFASKCSWKKIFLKEIATKEKKK